MVSSTHGVWASSPTRNPQVQTTPVVVPQTVALSGLHLPPDGQAPRSHPPILRTQGSTSKAPQGRASSFPGVPLAGSASHQFHLRFSGLGNIGNEGPDLGSVLIPLPSSTTNTSVVAAANSINASKRADILQPVEFQESRFRLLARLSLLVASNG